MIELKEMPALTFLLQSDVFNGHPFECSDCPFGEALGEADDYVPPNDADPGEGHYRCMLKRTESFAKSMKRTISSPTGIRPVVWGEDPNCDLKDWQTVASEEVAQAVINAAERGREGGGK